MRTIYSQAQYHKTKQVAGIIGDVSTILILYELINFGEKSFNELKRMTDINAVTLSKKLHLLKAQGLVDCRECGRENHYFVTSQADQYRPIIKEVERLVLSK